MRCAIPTEQAYRLLNHGPTALVTSAHDGRRNVMAAAWNMPLDFNPPKVAIVIDRNTYTRVLIEASGSFAINLPCREQAQTVMQVGSASGRERLEQGLPDKISACQLATFDAGTIAAPLIEGCVAWLECRLLPEPHLQEKYDLFLAEVVAAQADSRVFSEGRWHFEDNDGLRTIHHVAGGHFFATGEAFSAGQR